MGDYLSNLLSRNLVVRATEAAPPVRPRHYGRFEKPPKSGRMGVQRWPSEAAAERTTKRIAVEISAPSISPQPDAPRPTPVERHPPDLNQPELPGLVTVSWEAPTEAHTSHRLAETHGPETSLEQIVQSVKSPTTPKDLAASPLSAPRREEETLVEADSGPSMETPAPLEQKHSNLSPAALPKRQYHRPKLQERPEKRVVGRVVESTPLKESPPEPTPTPVPKVRPAESEPSETRLARPSAPLASLEPTKLAPESTLVRPKTTRMTLPRREAQATPEPATTIHVSVGSIEVRAEQPAKPDPEPPRAHPAVMSLDEYLRQRTNGRQS